MSHLGERVCDLVDGQLAPQEAEQAHVHLAACRACRDLVDAERLTKARLAALAGPTPTDDLVGRLLALGGPAGPVPPREGHVPGSPRPRTVAVGGTRSAGATPSDIRAGRRPGGVPRPARLSAAAAAAIRPAASASTRALRSTGRRTRNVRLAVAMLGALGAVGAGVGALVATAPVATASVVPAAFDAFVVRHAGVTARLPLLDVSAGWQLTRRGIVPTSGEGGTSKR